MKKKTLDKIVNGIATGVLAAGISIMALTGFSQFMGYKAGKHVPPVRAYHYSTAEKNWGTFFDRYGIVCKDGISGKMLVKGYGLGAALAAVGAFYKGKKKE